MTMYSYECEGCNREILDTLFRPIGGTHNDSCPVCTGTLRRAISFVFAKGMREHWNPTTGSYVQNERHFVDELKRSSEEMSFKTGMTHDYQPVDLRDMDACGATDEGLEHTKKVRRDTGLDPASTTTIIL